ncbi:MAG: hypothetical protein MSA89_05245 [Clostridium sp.]|nr:hypothetical protein [Clostridium sp.]
MRVVNWYKYMQNPYVEQETENKYENKKWKDLITGNIFFLNESDEFQIEAFASKYIVELLNKKDYENLFKYLRGEEKELKYNKNRVDSYELWLFPQLPYFNTNRVGNESIVCPRLMDYLSMRTGLLYVISDEKNKEEIRLISYLTGVYPYVNDYAKKAIDKIISGNNYKNYKAMLEEIDEVFKEKISDDVINKKLENYKFNIIKGGVVKVKEYLLETNKIKEIRGASTILDKINREIIPKKIDKEYIKECIVYAGGGNVLLVASKGKKGEELSKEIEEIYEDSTILAQNVAISKEVSLFDISKVNYKNTISKIENILNERQMAKIDYRTNDFKGNLDYFGENIKKFPEYKGEEELCSSCNLRLAKYIYPNSSENLKLCLSCLHKNIIGNKNKDFYKFKKDYNQYAKNNGIVINSVEKINTLEDIKSDSTNSIGVIYGDGNNMGAVIKNVSNILEMKYFSNKTEDSIFDAVYGAISKNLGSDKFEIIALGGDDIFIIVPGENAVGIAKSIGERFDSAFKNYSEDSDENLTMSLGVVIAKYNKPIQYLFDMSMQLLKSAKKKAKKEKKGTIDLIILETDAGFASNVKYLRSKLITNEKVCTLKPYTYDDLESLIRIITILKGNKGEKANDFRGKAYKFFEATMQTNVEEGNLYYAYQRARMDSKNNKKDCNKDKEREILDSIYKEFNEKYDTCNSRQLYIKDKEKRNLSIWGDIVELWDYVQEGDIDVKE